jgi:metal-responsive CopG/Arc/MetJ family transcriptional regulator
MKKIGRPRKPHALRKENISVNLPKTLVSEVESQLHYGSSRSTWIEMAIRDKLNSPFTVAESSTIQLMLALTQRKDFQDADSFAYKYIENMIKSMMQVEGTVKEQ